MSTLWLAIKWAPFLPPHKLNKPSWGPELIYKLRDFSSACLLLGTTLDFRFHWFLYIEFYSNQFLLEPSNSCFGFFAPCDMIMPPLFLAASLHLPLIMIVFLIGLIVCLFKWDFNWHFKPVSEGAYLDLLFSERVPHLFIHHSVCSNLLSSSLIPQNRLFSVFQVIFLLSSNEMLIDDAIYSWGADD